MIGSTVGFIVDARYFIVAVFGWLLVAGKLALLWQEKRSRR
jgi:hypothetical protein